MDAVLLFTTAPFFTAELGWPFLGERVEKQCEQLMRATIGFAITRIVVMPGGATEDGNTLGNLFAVGSAVCFAPFKLVLCWRKQGGLTATVLLSGLFAIAICFGIMSFKGSGMAGSRQYIINASLMGAFQTGARLVLYTRRARTVPAVQLALLPLIEDILSPFWVAIIIGESPAAIVLGCGLLV